MRIPAGVIKEWRRKQEEKRHRDEGSRPSALDPAQLPSYKRPGAKKEDRKPTGRIVINLS